MKNDCISYKNLKRDEIAWQDLPISAPIEGYTFLPQDGDVGYFFMTMLEGRWSACHFTVSKKLKRQTTKIRIVALRQKLQCCQSDLALDFETAKEEFIVPVHDLDRALGLPDEVKFFLQPKEIDTLTNIKKEIELEMIEPKGILIIHVPVTPLIYYQLWNKKQKGKNTLLLTQVHPGLKTVLLEAGGWAPVLFGGALKKIGSEKIEKIISALSQLVYSQKVIDVLGE